MPELISKEAVIGAIRALVPEAEWLLRHIESQDGYFRFPPFLSETIVNLKIGNYPLLYGSEAAIWNMFLRGMLTDDEVKLFNAEINTASPEELGSMLTELSAALGEAIDRMEIPKTPEQRSEGKRIFDAMSPEEQKKAVHVSQHFYCTFIASFFQNLSVMVHGEKLTALVARAKQGQDDAFVKAVQIDKRILMVDPYFIERFARAQQESDRNFLDSLSYRLKTAPYRGKIRHKSLWLVFSVLDQFQWLDVLPHREILDICDEAGVGGYENRIQDVKYLGKRIAGYREFQKRGIVSTP